MWFSAPLPPLSMAAALAVVFGAGIVRGFAGFGFSALSVAGPALPVSPAKVVPAIFVLGLLAGISLLRSAARDIDWHWLGWPIAGNVLCLPLGILLVAWLPETPLRLLIGRRSFAGVSPARFRRQVLNLRMPIAAISVLRALLELVGKSGA